MPIDFPNSPNTGDIHTVGGTRWQYDGAVWNVIEGDALQTVETKTADYTLLTADAGKILQIDKSTAATVTVNGSLDLATGDRIDIIQRGAGQVTVAASSPATVSGSSGLKLRAQWSAASLICVAPDSYILVGDLVVSSSNTLIDSFAVNLTGAWSANNPTNSTSGTSFTAPSSGLYLVTFAGSAFTSTGGNTITLTAHLNGSSTAGATARHHFNDAGKHHALTPGAATVTLNAGTNYVWIKQAGTGANSDGFDYAMFSGIKVSN